MNQSIAFKHTYILAHDLGTTGNKASLFDESGRLVGAAFAGYETRYPQPNWAEQNPTDWLRAIAQSTRNLISAHSIQPEQIAAVSFSGQMMGVVPVDKAGRPLRACIIWADQRAVAQAEQMASNCGADEIYRRTGHRASPAYTAPKIMWLRDHQPQIYEQAVCFLHPKDYCTFWLTGQFVTDYSDASGTLLFDLDARTWHQPFLQALGLDVDRLPRLHPSATVMGEVTTTAAAETGLRAGTPVVIGGGDGACAGVGAGVVEPGAAYCYIGSSGWIGVSSAQPIVDAAQRIITFHHALANAYAPMGVMQAAGGARDWAWRLLADHDVDLDEAAAAVSPGADGLLFLPHLLGERSPHWNPRARGTLVGLSMAHGKAEIARAALEGVAFNLRLILDALTEHVPDITAMRLIGGGGKSSLWPQMLADCFGLPIQLLELNSEATSWGAAVIGGVAVGLYDWSIAAEQGQVVQTVEPDVENGERYAELVQIYADTYAALKPIYERLQ